MKRILFAALTAAALFSGGILQSLNAQNMEIPKKVSPFPVGDKLPEQFSKYFIGQAWLAPLTDDKRLNAPVSNVTFSPGCRNNWHSHTGGQLLIAVGGRGYYQEKGRPVRALLPGDIVEIAPDVVHWHGAAPDSWFSHLAVACNPATNENTWLEPVDDAQYAAATASVPAPASRLGEDARRRLAELFPGGIPELGDADPELFEIFGNFALGEVTAYGQLDTRTRMLCILASNIASQGRTAYRTTLEGALNAGVTPVEVKEALYQAVPYVGMAKVADFVGITNEVLEARGVTLPLSVNLSAMQLMHPTMVSEMLELIHRYRIKPDTLTLEVTESRRIDDPNEAVAILKPLRNAGIRIALDDFGMGYAGLRQLQHMKTLPVDVLKIDKAFVDGLPDDSSMVQAIIQMARSLNLHLIAEGIETDAQRAWLAEAGVESGQGFLFAPAVPSDVFEERYLSGADNNAKV